MKTPPICHQYNQCWICFCRIYERVVEAPYMDIPEDASFWLGQRNAAHGFFKVSTNFHSHWRRSCLCDKMIQRGKSRWRVSTVAPAFRPGLSLGLLLYLLPLCLVCLVLFIIAVGFNCVHFSRLTILIWGLLCLPEELTFFLSLLFPFSYSAAKPSAIISATPHNAFGEIIK